MKLKIAAVALAVLLVGAGAAAAIPGQAADQAHSDANDSSTTADGHQPDDVGAPADADNDTENDSANASERRGPPEDMPGPVPDHVSQIHETINGWLDSGKEGSLGDMISDIVGGGDEADENADDDADAEGNTTATSNGEATETSTADGQ